MGQTINMMNGVRVVVLYVLCISHIFTETQGSTIAERDQSDDRSAFPSTLQTTEATDSVIHSREASAGSSQTHEAGESTTDKSSTANPETSYFMSSEISSIFGRAMNFSYLDPFTDGVQLTLAMKTIDLGIFIVDESNAKLVDGMLRGRSISDFLYVASKLAGIEAQIAARENKTVTTLALEDIFDSMADTVLTPEDVDELEREIDEDSSVLDLKHTSEPTASGRTKRKAISSTNQRWPTTIPYRISTDFDEAPDYRSAINDGIRHWEEETCLNFQRVSDYHGHHLIFRKLDGCFSNLGMIPSYNYGQDISIGEGCHTIGIVAHEIGHAIGLDHEHQRPDRDSYVEIHSENIKEGLHFAFLKKNWQEHITLGIPYDYSSNMHYGLDYFSKNGRHTLSVKEDDMGKVVGTQKYLSFYDVKLANYLYCRGTCSQGLIWSACKNDGYRNPKDCSRCKCPDGWSGRYCTEIKPGVNATCGAVDLTASSYWKTLKSPNFDTSMYPANSECTWRIKTAGYAKRIVLRFTGTFRFLCTIPCVDYLEVRHKDMIKSGPRYCCSSAPSGQIVSHGNEVLLLMRVTTGNRNTGFSLQYKVESCGGCSVAAGILVVSPCVETQTYACNQRYSDCSGRPCLTRYIYRQNTCYREVKTCCSGFELRGDNCVRAWSTWSAWSTCSKTCNSGVTTRRRTCITPPCRGSTTVSRSCSINSYCPGQWSNWSSWSGCSKTCGYGTRSRRRTCYKPPCSGSTTNQRSCYYRSCVCSYRARCGGWWNWPRYCTRYRSC